MKLSSIITDRVRPILNDETATFDWSNALLIRFYNDAAMLLRSKRPETKLNDAGDEIPFVDATEAALTEDVPFDDKWRPAFVDYILSRAFEVDAGDRRDSDRATHHWDNFSRYLDWL